MLFRIVCQQGGFEPEIVDRLVHLARPGTTVFDIGANIGLMSIPVLRACATCRVVSFEPSPSSLPFIQRTASESIYSDRWTVVPRGLSKQSGELDFAVGRPEEAPYEGFRSGERMLGTRLIKVAVSTLDEEWHQIGGSEVSVVKIDVEGAEGLVLEGGSELFNACHPDLLVEWHEPYLKKFGTPPDQLLSVARKFGYRIYTVPAGVPIDEERTLRVQMFGCQNFLLMR